MPSSPVFTTGVTEDNTACVRGLFSSDVPEIRAQTFERAREKGQKREDQVRDFITPLRVIRRVRQTMNLDFARHFELTSIVT